MIAVVRDSGAEEKAVFETATHRSAIRTQSVGHVNQAYVKTIALFAARPLTIAKVIVDSQTNELEAIHGIRRPLGR